MSALFAGAGYYRISTAPGQRIVAWCVPRDGGGTIAAFRSQAAARDPAKAIATYSAAEFAAVAVEAICPLAAG
ncbi:hypothetical protein [Bosea massiliensis]|uniref:Uncharacterized protein n=1 Tax=Bosea massiliensis TaxID=151419 RepID=A0ABW0P7W0_9HYPH